MEYQYKITIFTLLSLFLLFKSQVTILGPPTVVNKVKELEDGSKYTIFKIIFKNIQELDIL